VEAKPVLPSVKRYSVGMSALLAAPIAGRAHCRAELRMERCPVAGPLGARDSVVCRNASGPIAVDQGTGDVLSSLDLAFLGALEARNGRWGLTPIPSVPIDPEAATAHSAGANDPTRSLGGSND
jgi:hypothetical protein